MKKYRTSSFGEAIEIITIEKETQDSYWIGGRRNKKITSWNAVFDSFEQAKEHLLKNAEKGVESAKRNLEYATSKLAAVRLLKPLNPPNPNAE